MSSFASLFRWRKFQISLCVDYKNELRSLNRELQLHILELADVLVDRPSQYAKRIGEISSIFKNLHHLLNSLRPHQVKKISSSLNYNMISSVFVFTVLIIFSYVQARATLIHIMELQIQQRKQAVEDIKRCAYFVCILYLMVCLYQSIICSKIFQKLCW